MSFENPEHTYCALDFWVTQENHVDVGYGDSVCTFSSNWIGNTFLSVFSSRLSQSRSSMKAQIPCFFKVIVQFCEYLCVGVTVRTTNVTQAQDQKSGLTMTGLLISSIVSHPSFL